MTKPAHRHQKKKGANGGKSFRHLSGARLGEGNQAWRKGEACLHETPTPKIESRPDSSGSRPSTKPRSQRVAEAKYQYVSKKKEERQRKGKPYQKGGCN